MTITTGALQTQQPLASQNYPFMDNASMISRSGQFIPPSVFSDARLYPTNGSETQFISKITVSPGIILITIDNPTGTTGTVSVLDFSVTTFSVLDANGFDIGVLLLDPYLLQAVVPVNTTQEFDNGALTFTTTAVIPQPWGGVTGIVDSNSNYISGDVWLVGEDGVILGFDVDTNSIVVNVVGDPLYIRKLCLAEGASDIFPTRRPLEHLEIVGLPTGSFNISPDAFGNIQMVLDKSNENIVRIQPTSNGLAFSVINGNT